MELTLVSQRGWQMEDLATTTFMLSITAERFSENEIEKIGGDGRTNVRVS